MDRYEEAVLEYITADTYRFANWQFDLPYQNQEGGSCPDFVVLDYREKSVYAVEVTMAWNIKGLIEKLVDRKRYWINPIKNHLIGINSQFQDWEYRVTVFVREGNDLLIGQKFKNCADIAVKTIEKISFPYSWTWNGNVPCNPLR
ncbi:MAG: hypothetical protein V9G63_13680 [Candidatus Competibacter sp.]